MSIEAVQEITIQAAPATIFPYLVDPDLFVRWMGTEVTIDPTPGGTFRALCSGTHQSAGEFREIVPNERVVFTFGWDEPGHPIPPGSSEVEITLTPVAEGTVVRLTHRGLPEDAVGDHTRGWTYYLARLDLASRGIDPGPDRAGEATATERP
jgi:uncharacterized protein YndB with AHSA1/START domain